MKYHIKKIENNSLFAIWKVKVMKNVPKLKEDDEQIIYWLISMYIRRVQYHSQRMTSQGISSLSVSTNFAKNHMHAHSLQHEKNHFKPGDNILRIEFRKCMTVKSQKYHEFF